MAEYAVNTDHLRQYAQQISSLKNELDSVGVRLGAMQFGSILRMRATTALIGQLSDCKMAIVHHSQNVTSLSNGLTEVANLYDRYERALTDPTDRTGVTTGSDGAVPDWLEEGLGILSEGAPIFGIGSAIAGFVDGTASGIVSGIDALVNVIGDGCDAIFATNGGVNADWAERLFGLNKSGVEGLSAAWDDFVDGFNFSNKTTTAGKVSVACKWAGVALTFVSSGIENFDEHGGMNNARFWGETIIEGAVDFTLGATAGMLIAAALPAAAPAIVVGAIGAGVVWAANAICEAVSGRDIAEHVSDFVCDTAESIGYAIRGAAEATASVVDAACDWIRGWFD